jgi:hypothetical protein
MLGAGGAGEKYVSFRVDLFGVVIPRELLLCMGGVFGGISFFTPRFFLSCMSVLDAGVRVPHSGIFSESSGDELYSLLRIFRLYFELPR